MTAAPRWRAHSATSGSSHTTATGSGALAATTRSAMDRTRSIRIVSDMVPPSRRLAWRNPLTGISTTSGPNEAPERVGSGRGVAETPADTFDSVRGRGKRVAWRPYASRRERSCRSYRSRPGGNGGGGPDGRVLPDVAVGAIARIGIVDRADPGERDLSGRGAPARRPHRHLLARRGGGGRLGGVHGGAVTWIPSGVERPGAACRRGRSGHQPLQGH